jgi:hypothetical protein
VNEIDAHGQVVKLTNFDLPIIESPKEEINENDFTEQVV